MILANLSDSETARNTYDKGVEYFLMRTANLSDSETARNTYDKGMEYLPPNPNFSTTIPQLNINNTKKV